MKRESKLIVSLICILLLIFLITFNINLVLSAETSTPVCVETTSGMVCLTEKNIPDKVKDFATFNALPEKLKKYILNNYFEEFLKGIKKATIEEQLKYIQANKKGDFSLNDTIRTKIFQGLDKEQADNLGKKFFNKKLKELYKEDKYPLGIKKVDIDWKNIRLEGHKLIGKDGGYIKFDESDSRISRTVSEIAYKDGEFSETFTTFGARRTLKFTKGTVDTEGRAVNPNGRVVGKEKSLSLVHVWDGDGTKESIIQIKYSEDGKSAEFYLNGDPERAIITTKDVNGNLVILGLNEDNREEDGKILDKWQAVIKVDEDSNIEVKSAQITTAGYGDYKTSNKGFTRLAGNVFDNPEEGIKDLQSRLKDLMTSATRKKILEDVKKAFKLQPLEATPEVLEAKKIELKNTIVDSIVKDYGMTKEDAESLFDMTSPIQELGKKIGERLNTQAGLKSGLESLMPSFLSDLGVLVTTGQEGALEGKGTIIGPSIKKSFEESLKELSQPFYQKYEEEGKNYLVINDLINEQTNQHFYQVGIGGNYMMADVTNFKGEIGLLSVNNYGHQKSGGKSNEEIIYMNNGGFLLGFKGDKYTDGGDNQIIANSNAHSYNGAETPIKRIENVQANDEFYYKLNIGQNGVEFYRSDERISLDAGGTYLIGDQFGVRGSMFYVGGSEAQNIFKNTDIYPLPDDAQVKFEINPEYIGDQGRRFGHRIRALIAQSIGLDKISSQAGRTTQQIANQFDDNVYKMLSSVVETKYDGDVEAFYKQMNLAQKVIGRTDSLENSGAITSGGANRALANIFPGEDPQRMRDMVYLVNNPNAYAKTMSGFASLNQKISIGVSASLSNKGFAFQGQLAPNQDPAIARLLLSGIAQNPQEDTWMTTTEATSRAGEGGGDRAYNLDKKLHNSFSGASAFSPLSTLTQPQTPATPSTQNCTDGSCDSGCGSSCQ